jgi:hypothetical protein
VWHSPSRGLVPLWPFHTACEFFSGLGGNSLDVSLKDEEVLGFDENVVLYKSFVIRGVGDGSFVELVLRSPGRRYPALNIHP